MAYTNQNREKQVKRGENQGVSRYGMKCNVFGFSNIWWGEDDGAAVTRGIIASNFPIFTDLWFITSFTHLWNMEEVGYNYIQEKSGILSKGP